MATAKNTREKKYHSLEKTRGSGSDLGFERTGVNACGSLGFLSRYGGRRTPAGWGEAEKY